MGGHEGPTRRPPTPRAGVFGGAPGPEASPPLPPPPPKTMRAPLWIGVAFNEDHRNIWVYGEGGVWQGPNTTYLPTWRNTTVDPSAPFMDYGDGAAVTYNNATITGGYLCSHVLEKDTAAADPHPYTCYPYDPFDPIAMYV